VRSVIPSSKGIVRGDTARMALSRLAAGWPSDISFPRSRCPSPTQRGSLTALMVEASSNEARLTNHLTRSPCHHRPVAPLPLSALPSRPRERFETDPPSVKPRFVLGRAGASTAVAEGDFRHLPRNDCPALGRPRPSIRHRVSRQAHPPLVRRFVGADKRPRMDGPIGVRGRQPNGVGPRMDSLLSKRLAQQPGRSPPMILTKNMDGASHWRARHVYVLTRMGGSGPLQGHSDGPGIFWV